MLRAVSIETLLLQLLLHCSESQAAHMFVFLAPTDPLRGRDKLYVRILHLTAHLIDR